MPVVVIGGALAVLAVGFYLGPRPYLANGGGPWADVLATTFRIWDSHPPGEHFFLTFRSPEHFATGRAYPHAPQPWMFFLYLCLQPWRWLGASYENAQIAASVPQFALILLLLVASLSRGARFDRSPLRAVPAFRLVVLTLAAAGVVTLPAFWVPFFRFNPDHWYLLPAFSFAYLAVVDAHREMRGRDAVIAIVPIALCAPLYTPFLVVSWYVLWGLGTDDHAETNWRTVGLLAAVGLLGVIVFAFPSVLGRLAGFHSVGSSFLYRSGLDGSEQHFTSMLQALWSPSYPPGRAWHFWHWPAAALAAIGVAAVHSAPLAARMLRQLFICWLPLLWMVIVFPQAVSIHPYIFDFTATFGAAFCLVGWLQWRDLDPWCRLPALRLAILMMFAALLMTNLIDLARLGRLVPGVG